jgi:hypothetical protein
LRPLVAANKQLSTSIGALDAKSSSRTASQSAAAAQAALNTTSGAVGTLSPPSSQQALAGQVKQALTAENGYLQAISSTLQTPSGPSAGQLQTLATGAQSALVALDGLVATAGSSISGASTLGAWAHSQTARPKKPASKPKAAASSTTTTVTAAAPSSGAAAGSGAGGASATETVSCGDGLFGGPHTSCPFAENVQQAWEAASSATTEVTAYSPVTNLSYTEQCGPIDDGDEIQCVGVGNPSSVLWGN